MVALMLGDNGVPIKLTPAQLPLIEEALRLSELRYQQIVETAMEGIWIIDADNKTMFVNQMMANMLGYSIDEMIGKSMFEFMDESGQAGALENVERRRQGVQEQHDFKFRRRDGSDVWAIISTNPLFDERGEYIGALGMLTDITERKQWEDFLQEANEQLGIQVATQETQLQEALYHLQQEIKKRKQVEVELRVALDGEKELNQLKSHFVSMVSHEFCNPLAVISTASYLLENIDLDVNEQAQYFQMIQRSVEQMKQLMQDVLLVGEAEAKKVQVNPAMLDLNHFCRCLLAELQLNLDESYQLQMINLCADQKVYWDAKLLRKILCNLLTNAIKYSPQGGAIQLEITRHNEELVFQVKDEGIGIPQRDLPHLFESFSRAGNVGQLPGSGLGLAIAKQCVDALGGQISVVSEEQEGATFRVVLPLVIPSQGHFILRGA